MFVRLNRLILRISVSGWWFAGTALLAFASLSALKRIGAGFPAVAGGAQPFDLQNGLTADQILQQLAGYTDQARQTYLVFTSIDYVFPFAAGLFLAALGAFGLRHGFPGVYAEAARRNLFPLFLAGTLFDWCENIASLTAIMSYPDTSAALAGAVVLAKGLKLVLVSTTQGLAVLLLLAAAAKRLRRRLGSS